MAGFFGKHYDKNLHSDTIGIGAFRNLKTHVHFHGNDFAVSSPRDVRLPGRTMPPKKGSKKRAIGIVAI